MELREVFEPVLNIVKNFQKKEKEPASKQAAKDRLKLVLMQDRASVSPDFFDMMKKELIDVIKKYIEIDEESLDVQLTRGMEVGLEGPALYANIPIKQVKPVAPQGEHDEEMVMSEERADEVAEEILNQIEEAAKMKAMEEAKTIEDTKTVDDVSNEVISQVEDEIKEVKDTETTLDELHRFANEEIKAVREGLNLVSDTEEVDNKEEIVEKEESEEKAVKKTTAKKKVASKKTAKKKKEE